MSYFYQAAADVTGIEKVPTVGFGLDHVSFAPGNSMAQPAVAGRDL